MILPTVIDISLIEQAFRYGVHMIVSDPNSGYIKVHSLTDTSRMSFLNKCRIFFFSFQERTNIM